MGGKRGGEQERVGEGWRGEKFKGERAFKHFRPFSLSIPNSPTVHPRLDEQRVHTSYDFPYLHWLKVATSCFHISIYLYTSWKTRT